MTHVFVVDQTTFKYHLEYLFAGTGAKDKTSPFLANGNINYNSTTAYVYNGTTWVPATPYVYNGSKWVQASANVYNNGWR